MFRGGNISRTIISTGGTSRTVRATSGCYLDLGYYMSVIPTSHKESDSISNGSYSTKNCGVVFGSGTTAPTIDDIDLEHRITSGLSILSGGLSLGKVADGQYCAWASYTVTNTSEEEITISEIGILTNFVVSNSENAAILMERTVLDEPIVIAPGDQKIITYAINFYH
jgi:hypothetical protein